MSHRFVIIGAGVVGTALARLLRDAGYEFVGAASRTLESAEKACAFAGAGGATTDPRELTREADLVFVTTPDETIQAVAAHLGRSRALKDGATVAHCSGALPSSILSDVRASGAHAGSMHPMQSFATSEQAVRAMRGSVCCVEGETAAVSALSAVAHALGCQVVNIEPENKALYHAAGCVASNYLVALQHAALKLNEAAGIGREDALRIMLPLLRGTLDNFEKVGLPGCLTGPVSRGDIDTVRRHMDALAEHAPDLLPLYRILGLQAVEVGEAKGTLGQAAAAELKALFR